MKHFSKILRISLCLVLVYGLLSSCNKDDVVESDIRAPKISLDSDNGVYTVKVGHQLTIAPDFENVDVDDITWLMDDEIVARGPEWTEIWNEEGTFYATVEAHNSLASVREEIRIDVLEMTPPVISLAMPTDGFKVAPGADLKLTPDYQHSDLDGFGVVWYVDGQKVADTPDYTFNRDIEGVYSLRVEAVNIDGSASKEFKIIVERVDERQVLFVPMAYNHSASTIFTFKGRVVALTPFVNGFAEPQFIWMLDGDFVDCKAPVYNFAPQSAGQYKIKVIVRDGSKPESQALSRNATAVDGISAEITVVCVDATESQRQRPSTPLSSAVAVNVYDWIPGPGQFINETTSAGGMTGSETTLDAACRWAEKRLADKLFVSLGAFGGYITVGFDHSIVASDEDYDFTIDGNAFVSPNSGSNEPGVVWVMQDVNGNGLPDDEWFELKGSVDDTANVRRRYAVTYYRPDAVNSDVYWSSCDGRDGKVLCLTQYHRQDYYYPAWVEPSAYTLYGTILPSNNSQSASTGFWNNAPFDWGYADNAGNDCLSDKSSGGEGQTTGFRIANAIDAAGNPVKLGYIDFVKVQSGVLANSGILGEVSTEVCGFADYHMKK